MEKKVYDKTRISMCCQAPVFVGGDDREGTHYYICEKCNKPCDSEGLNTDILFRELDKAREEGKREALETLHLKLNDCVVYINDNGEIDKGVIGAVNRSIIEELSKLRQ